MKYTHTIILMVIILTAFISCEDDDYTPKPKGYFRIDLPEKSYRQYTSPGCPFTFEYPEYARVKRDTLFFGEKIEDPCWMNISFPDLGGKLHLSYKEVNEENQLPKLIDDAHKLTFKHTIKAEYIDESFISNPHHVDGILYEVGGNAASNIQFFVTDSIQHYLRGALYFSATPNEDSLAPVIDFVKADLLHLVKTLRWEGEVEK